MNNKRLDEDSSFKIKPLKERTLTFGEKIQRAGEAPVIHNQILTNATVNQLSNYLFNKGCFNSIIKDTLIIHKNRQVSIRYDIKIGSCSRLNKITYQCDDNGINSYMDSIKHISLLNEGDQFDTYILYQVLRSH